MAKRIFVINPGSTSTKVALFDGGKELYKDDIVHSSEELDKFETINDQLGMRLEYVLRAMEVIGCEPGSLDIVMGRGGLFPPLESGGYLVDEAMRRTILHKLKGAHASNLGALLAYEVAKRGGVNAYIYDAVSVDELDPTAKITGMPEVVRVSNCHVLNSKAVSRHYAAGQGRIYEEMNFIVAHLGGGISVSAHKKGRIADCITDDGGPFSPERAGSIPIRSIIDMCYSGEYTKEQMTRKSRGMGGLRALLGTSDCRDVQARADAGDGYARLCLDAMCLQIAKGIGNICPILEGEIDAIILTGGVARSKYITDCVTRLIGFMAPVVVIPGEMEMEALAAGGLRILNGEETHLWPKDDDIS